MVAGSSYPVSGENCFNPRKETARFFETSVSVCQLHVVQAHKNTMWKKNPPREAENLHRYSFYWISQTLKA